MSRSQFYSIKLFILRHAWLNLWDKHMTTGRINQVTLLSTTKNLLRPWGTKQTPCCSTHMQPKLRGVNCWLKSIVRSHRNASWLLNSFNLSPARSTQKLTAQLSNGAQQASFRTTTLDASHNNKTELKLARAELSERSLRIVLVSMSTYQVNIQTATIFEHDRHKVSMPFKFEHQKSFPWSCRAGH